MCFILIFYNCLQLLGTYRKQVRSFQRAAQALFLINYEYKCMESFCIPNYSAKSLLRSTSFAATVNSKTKPFLVVVHLRLLLTGLFFFIEQYIDVT